MVTTRADTPSSSAEKPHDKFGRIFDKDFSLSSYGRADDPLDMVVYDPKAGFSRLGSVFPNVVHTNTAVVCTGGSCRGNGKPSAAASFNLAATTSNQFASLYSVGNVIGRLEAALEVLPSYETTLEVDIVSNSSYAVHGLTRDISRWSRNGFKNSRNKPVAHGSYIKELHEGINRLADRNVNIRFWLDNERKSRHAYILARSMGRPSNQPIIQKMGSGMQYFIFDAVKDSKARRLAKKLGFRLPQPRKTVEDSSKASVVEDSDKNWALLFGPTWNSSWVAESS